MALEQLLHRAHAMKPQARSIRRQRHAGRGDHPQPERRALLGGDVHAILEHGLRRGGHAEAERFHGDHRAAFGIDPDLAGARSGVVRAVAAKSERLQLSAASIVDRLGCAVIDDVTDHTPMKSR